VDPLGIVDGRLRLRKPYKCRIPTPYRHAPESRWNARVLT
jgi:hypothetical protein